MARRRAVQLRVLADAARQVKQQLDEEIKHLTSSFAALRSAEAKFRNAKEAADALTQPGAEGALSGISN